MGGCCENPVDCPITRLDCCTFGDGGDGSTVLGGAFGSEIVAVSKDSGLGWTGRKKSRMYFLADMVDYTVLGEKKKNQPS